MHFKSSYADNHHQNKHRAEIIVAGPTSVVNETYKNDSNGGKKQHVVVQLAGLHGFDVGEFRHNKRALSLFDTDEMIHLSRVIRLNRQPLVLNSPKQMRPTAARTLVALASSLSTWSIKARILDCWIKVS